MKKTISLNISQAFREKYPGASVGILAMEGVTNPRRHPDLDRRKREVEKELRATFGEKDRIALKADPVIQAYDAYYRAFRKTYHVLLQLESVAHKGKPIPSVAALVEVAFIAELTDRLLTASHDLSEVQAPLFLDVAQGHEEYIRLNGQKQTLKPDDMFISDERGVLSSVIYGPNRRSRLRPGTRDALFTTYAPAGIDPEHVSQHLEGIMADIQMIEPDARSLTLKVLTAN
jgi:DNA/RNA-binding domain of Phe-tRNA-synthetase-like protein